jgi:hypothetical protein
VSLSQPQRVVEQQRPLVLIACELIQRFGLVLIVLRTLDLCFKPFKVICCPQITIDPLRLDTSDL